MDSLTNKISLGIIIPVLNEAQNLSLLLADLAIEDQNIETIIVDGGSTDFSRQISHNYGASVVSSIKSSRGFQICNGIKRCSKDWYLIIHGDCRLSKGWLSKIRLILGNDKSKSYAWFFDFKVSERSFMLLILEKLVYLRSTWFQRPYGDQGLLIHKNLLTSVGGFKPISLMEDLDLVKRISAQTKLLRIGSELTTSGRKWKKRSVIRQAMINFNLRRRWSKGDHPDLLIKDYKKSVMD